jgi:hypothetical protein
MTEVRQHPVPHPDHFDATKFKPNGEPVGPHGGRPRKLKPEQRAQIYLLQVEIRQRERLINQVLDEAGCALGNGGRSQLLKRVWREKGM